MSWLKHWLQQMENRTTVKLRGAAANTCVFSAQDKRGNLLKNL